MTGLGTCDLLLCAGRGKLPGLIGTYNRLMGATGPAAEITHAAMAAMGGTSVFESTTLNAWCGKRGTQINPYKQWLAHYPGSVWVRRLRFTRDKAFEQAACDAMCELIGLPYENGIPGAAELALCGIEWPWFRRVFDTAHRLKTTELHCSEGDVVVLQAMKLCRLRTAAGRFVYANKMPPFEFWSGGKLETWLLCGIGKPERLK